MVLQYIIKGIIAFVAGMSSTSKAQLPLPFVPAALPFRPEVLAKVCETGTARAYTYMHSSVAMSCWCTYRALTGSGMQGLLCNQQ